MAKTTKKSSDVAGQTSPSLADETTTSTANEALDTSLDRLIKIAGGLPSESPSMPGFAMADDPVELPDLDHPPLDQPDLSTPSDVQVTWDPEVKSDPTTADWRQVDLAYDPSEVDPNTPSKAEVAQVADDLEKVAQRIRNPKPLPTKNLAAPATAAGLDGEILGPNSSTTSSRYEQRIQVLDAYQYPGHLREAPDWVDRNWAAYGDWDPVRNIEAGPALRVPLENGYAAMCRPGDYVVFQQIKLDARSSDQRIEVWPKDAFEKIFLRVD